MSTLMDLAWSVLMLTWEGILEGKLPMGEERSPRDGKMALNWGAHGPRRYSSFKLVLEIVRFYPEAQIRSRILWYCLGRTTCMWYCMGFKFLPSFGSSPRTSRSASRVASRVSRGRWRSSGRPGSPRSPSTGERLTTHYSPSSEAGIRNGGSRKTNTYLSVT